MLVFVIVFVVQWSSLALYHVWSLISSQPPAQLFAVVLVLVNLGGFYNSIGYVVVRRRLQQATTSAAGSSGDKRRQAGTVAETAGNDNDDSRQQQQQQHRWQAVADGGGDGKVRLSPAASASRCGNSVGSRWQAATAALAAGGHKIFIADDRSESSPSSRLARGSPMTSSSATVESIIDGGGGSGSIISSSISISITQQHC